MRLNKKERKGKERKGKERKGGDKEWDVSIETTRACVQDQIYQAVIHVSTLMVCALIVSKDMMSNQPVYVNATRKTNSLT